MRRYLGERYAQLPGESNVDYFHRRIALRQQENAAWAAAATIDITWMGNPETINKIWQHLQAGKDFGLRNPIGGKVFFLKEEAMVSWHDKNASLNSFTTLTSQTFPNALKLAVIGHVEFMPFTEILHDNIYMQVATSYYGKMPSLISLIK